MAVTLSALCIGRSLPLPPGRFVVLISVKGWVNPRALVRPEGLGQLENLMISSGMEPATFRLVLHSASTNDATACPSFSLYKVVFENRSNGNTWVKNLLPLLYFSAQEWRPIISDGVMWLWTLSASVHFCDEFPIVFVDGRVSNPSMFSVKL
jgi:hypothetical protein